MKDRKLTEFEKDLINLNKTIEEKDIKAYRQTLMSMFNKMQTSNTKQFYKSAINRLTVAKTGEHYDNLFLLGFKGD